MPAHLETSGAKETPCHKSVLTTEKRGEKRAGHFRGLQVQGRRFRGLPLTNSKLKQKNNGVAGREGFARMLYILVGGAAC